MTSRQPSKPSARRVLHFPENRSMGYLFTQSVVDRYSVKNFGELEQDGFFYGVMSKDSAKDEAVEARGSVALPATEPIVLRVTEEAVSDLSPLASLQHDAFAVLDLGKTTVKDGQLANITNLTSLERLIISDTAIIGVAFHHIAKLESLRRLDMEWLHELALIGSPGAEGPIGVAGIEALQQLEVLNAAATRLTDTTMPIVARLKRLRILRLTDTDITDDGLEAIRGMQNLEYLDVRHNGGVRNRGLTNIAGLPRLKELHLATNLYTDVGLDVLKRLTKLEVLEIGGNYLPVSSNPSLAFLEPMTELRSLDLIWPEMVTDAGLAHLRHLTELSKLRIGGAITDAGLEHLRPLTKLSTLQISGTFTDAGLATLRHVPGLSRLEISGTFTDEGLRTIGGLASLKTLELSCPAVAGRGLKYLGGLPDLTWLRLHAKVDPNELEEFKKAHPQCKVYT